MKTEMETLTKERDELKRQLHATRSREAQLESQLAPWQQAAEAYPNLLQRLAQSQAREAGLIAALEACVRRLTTMQSGTLRRDPVLGAAEEALAITPSDALKERLEEAFREGHKCHTYSIEGRYIDVADAWQQSDTKRQLEGGQAR